MLDIKKVLDESKKLKKKKIEGILKKISEKKKIQEKSKKEKVSEKKTKEAPKEELKTKDKEIKENQGVFFEEETPAEEKPKVTSARILEEEVSRIGPSNQIGERQLVDLSKDYNSRNKRDPEKKGEEGRFGPYEAANQSKVSALYTDKNRDDESRNKTFYDTGGKDQRKDIYSPELIGDKGSENKFIQKFSDLEKKSEEATMGNFGIVKKREKDREDRHYDDIKYSGDTFK